MEGLTFKQLLLYTLGFLITGLIFLPNDDTGVSILILFMGAIGAFITISEYIKQYKKKRL